MLEYFGYRFTNHPDTLLESLDKYNLCFLHAPLFHPAMKNVAPVRKELGVKTFFNMLGPMVNPAQPNNQMVGVFSLELARLYGYLYQQGGKSFTVVHSLDGYDEVSLTGHFKLIDNKGEKLLSPEDLSMKMLQASDLEGGDTVEEAAGIFEKVLRGEGSSAQNEVVIVNAALALKTASQELSWEDARANAEDSLLGHKALQVFRKIIAA
jgi:anthranilate phosphoribosyltransferase